MNGRRLRLRLHKKRRGIHGQRWWRRKTRRERARARTKQKMKGGITLDTDVRHDAPLDGVCGLLYIGPLANEAAKVSEMYGCARQRCGLAGRTGKKENCKEIH